MTRPKTPAASWQHEAAEYEFVGSWELVEGGLRQMLTSGGT